MKEYAFSIATSADDEEIRSLLRHNPVPGRIAVSYEREPAYFTGCDIMGDFHQTVIARHRPTGALAGLGCRAIRRMFVNGHITDVGYLGQLRVDRQHQARGLVTAGFRFFRELDRDRRTDGYITTIVEGNRVAEGVLARRKSSSLPRYRELSRLHTLAIPAMPLRKCCQGSVEIRHACVDDVPEMVLFLNRYGAQKHFFPVLTEADFLPGAVRTRGLETGDFLLARQGRQIRGVMGLWDQSAYKQVVVKDYSGPLRWGRPLYNAFARCRGEAALPAPGDSFSLAYAAFTCVADNSPEIFDPLLQHLRAFAWQRGIGRILLGLTENDPLLVMARRYPHVPYVSQLYTACWKERSHFHDELDRRVSHVEIATI